MSWSAEEGKQITRNWITEYKDEIKRVLDIGAGSGTYYNKFGIPGEVLSGAEWTGVEIWEPFVEKYKLKEKYDILINQDARTVDYAALGKFDVAFAGDVLEHMTKEEAVLLVDALKKTCKRIIISIPIVHLPQGEYEGNPYEEHVKDDWSHTEVMETFKITRFWPGSLVGVYLMEV